MSPGAAGPGGVTPAAGDNDPAFAHIGGSMDRVLGMTSFVKVVDSGGFAAAGRALNMSPVLTGFQTG